MGPSRCGKTVLLRSLNRLHDMNTSVKVSENVFLIV